MSRRKHQSAFHQISKLDTERIVAYHDCGLSFRQISRHVGRNQITVIRLCDRWMQDGTTNRRGQSHPPQRTSSLEDRQIVLMAMTDHSVTSQTAVQHIKFVTHHSVTARTIRHRLQQSYLSARRPLFGLPLTQNHRCLHRQWCDERRMWVADRNEVVFTDDSRICLRHHNGRIRVWRLSGEGVLSSCVMHRHTGPAPAIKKALFYSVTDQSLRTRHVSKLKTVKGVNDRTRNDYHDSYYPSARHLAIIWTDTVALSEGIVYVWMADNDTFGTKRACRMI
ncbi:transposable element Tcb1 transposase [Trichonephila clavipes]|nr:transposable element Tcb1 transposase [Trichonephila clavipes]